jgi:hypothetical protein
MTDDQINIAIAENVFGWRQSVATHPQSGNLVVIWTDNKSNFSHLRKPANFCNDLNAMHDAEISLSGDGLECSLNEARYGEALFRVINPTKDGAGTSDFDKITASARQRAEAFLRTLGKWEEQS